MKYDVFISYSSHDQKVVEGLCAYLESLKIRCFVAYRDIPRGVVWARAIVEALDDSRMMVVVFSDHFNASDQVDREIELASEDKKPILTFRITDDAFKGAKKYYLKNINWIDAFPNPQASFGYVAENIGKLLDMDIASPTVEKKPAAPVINKTDKVLPNIDNKTNKPTPEQPRVVVNTVGAKYKVGDYYKDSEREGVIFEVSADGLHGKIVSMQQSGLLQWTSDRNESGITVGTDNSGKGTYNMLKVKRRPNWQQNYPAFKWCADLGQGWYLPAIDELESFTLDEEVYNAVNRTLEAKGAQKLISLGSFGYYWSSTEYSNGFMSCRVGMFSRAIFHDLKNYECYVRAVSAF